MAWPKGKKRGYKTGGRVKGSKNTFSKSVELRAMVEGALSEVGGQDYLIEQAREEPRAFLALIAKLLPTKVEGEVEHTGGVQIEVVTGFSSGPHQR
jgi:hypothetical protein